MVYVQHERPAQHQCALCGSTEGLSPLHHFFSAREFAARATVNNSIYLCSRCHPIGEKHRLDLILLLIWNRQEQILEFLRTDGPRLGDWIP